MQDIIVKLLFLITGALIGVLFKIILDNRKRKIEFYADSYKDIWELVRNVTVVISRGRLVDHDKVMEQIQSKYSCKDINSFLLNCPGIEDEKLKKYLRSFSDNLSSYQSEKARLQYPSMGDGQIDYKTIANDLLMKIQKRINRYLSK